MTPPAQAKAVGCSRGRGVGFFFPLLELILIAAPQVAITGGRKAGDWTLDTSLLESI